MQSTHQSSCALFLVLQVPVNQSIGVWDTPAHMLAVASGSRALNMPGWESKRNSLIEEIASYDSVVSVRSGMAEDQLVSLCFLCWFML